MGSKDLKCKLVKKKKNQKEGFCGFVGGKMKVGVGILEFTSRDFNGLFLFGREKHGFLALLFYCYQRRSVKFFEMGFWGIRWEPCDLFFSKMKIMKPRLFLALSLSLSLFLIL